MMVMMIVVMFIAVIVMVIRAGLAQSVVCWGLLSCMMQRRGFDPSLSLWR